MPLQTTTRSYAVPMPSFMSVYGGEDNAGLKDLPELDNKRAHGESLNRPATSGQLGRDELSPSTGFSIFHQQRDSTSTSASDSTESSPTTTISTMDGSTLTEPSPAPSPESPVTKLVPSSFSPDFKPRKTDASKHDNGPFFELQRPTTPAKKPRNLKNLAVNTAGVLGLGRAISTPSLQMKDTTTSAPTSPSFVKPPTPPARRRPSQLGLSIKTPANTNTNTVPRLSIPPTPSFKRPGALRHFQSSPSLPLMSPGAPPDGGMQLPAVKPSFKPVPHGFAEVLSEDDEEQEQNFDIPQSREEKPASYPNGPICIYESGVYLYFEPNAEVAGNFDVILNVASEVKNPFNGALNYSTAAGVGAAIDQEVNGRQDCFQLGRLTPSLPGKVVPVSTMATESAEPTQHESESPSTPKATPILEQSPLVIKPDSGKKTEYIHIPWEHNTDIVPDLFPLVKVIDDRIKKGKTVLVHCQCGVSRSASLIVAYGIYRNPGISVQEAYDAVKKRSKWIGPNMNLIMQLQEFRNGLLRSMGSGYGLSLAPRMHSSRMHSAGLPSAASADRRNSPFVADKSQEVQTPRTAPLPPDDAQRQRASTGNMMAISPGPLSAPSDFFSTPGFRRSWDVCQSEYSRSSPQSPAVKELPYVDPKGHIIPMLATVDTNVSANGEDKGVQTIKLEIAEEKLSRQISIRREKGLDTMRNQSLAPQTHSPSPREQIVLDERERQDSFGPVSSKATATSEQPLNFSLPLLRDPGSPLRPGSAHSETNPYRRRLLEASVPSSLLRSPGLVSKTFELPTAVESSDLASPRVGQFPTNPFRIRESPVKPLHTSNLVASSPEDEFHLTPLRQSKDVDTFGLTSPRIVEFPKDPFDHSPISNRHACTDPFVASQHVPQFPVQPPSLGGSSFFGNGITQATPHPLGFGSINIASRTGPLQSKHYEPPHMASLGETLRPHALEELRSTSQAPTPTPQDPQPLATPPRQLQPKYSSPNLQDQLRLHQLQSEIESRLPNRSPKLAPMEDDMDGLLSPRATEFTSNPFHISFTGLTQAKPTNPFLAASRPKEAVAPTTDWTAPKDSEEDPRSPAQKGGSPIIRNIWDVL